MMISAIRPWQSIDASGYVYYEGRWIMSAGTPTHDTQYQIELCMRCPFSDDCHDCVSIPKSSSKWARRRKARTKS